jgi:hypothetical protein
MNPYPREPWHVNEVKGNALETVTKVFDNSIASCGDRGFILHLPIVHIDQINLPYLVLENIALT